MKKLSTAFAENSIPAHFDEVDAGEAGSGGNAETITIRTVTDFEIRTVDGDLISMEDLQTKGPAVLFGSIVEPLPLRMREVMTSLLCTSNQEVPDDEAVAKLLPTKNRKVSFITTGLPNDNGAFSPELMTSLSQLCLREVRG
jgi:hypothetical protein